MKKRDYNQFTKSDIPLNSSFAPSILPDTFYAQREKVKPQPKPKINAIGKKSQEKLEFHFQKQVETAKLEL